MKPETGYDLAFKAQKRGATIHNWGDQNIEIRAPNHQGSVIVPRGEMRPSMFGFVCRVLRALALLALMFGGYAVVIRL